MASSERHLVDTALFAIDEINKQGGVLGKQLVGIVEDGCSDPATFKVKAEKLVEQDGVQVLSGCWTSSSRKAVQDTVLDKNIFLLYPVQYEGLEENPNILYSGSCLNQQISPAIEWCLRQGSKTFYLVGSDYVFPRTANALAESLLLDRGAKILGEDYLHLGATDFKEIAESIKNAQPDFVINTINGDSNKGFFNHYNKTGNEFPVMSFSISEDDLHDLGVENDSHYLCWSYFQNLDNKVNQRFLRNLGKHHRNNQIASDPAVMTYSQIHLWCQAVNKAGSLKTNDVRAHLHGQTFDSPAGLLEVMPNNHILKSAYIARQTDSGRCEIVWESDKRITPKPWLGMEDVTMSASKLVLDALNQYPNLIDLNTTLQATNLQLSKANDEIERHHKHLEALVEEKTKEIARNESMYRSLVSIMTSVVWVTDADGRFVEPQLEFEKFTGQVWEEHKGWGWVNMIHPDDRDKLKKLWADAVKNKTTYHADGRMMRANGEYCFFEAVAAPIFDDQGKFQEWVGTITDITDRKKAEESSTRLGKILEESLNEIYIFDAETLQFMLVNEGARKNLGYTMEELKKLTPLDLKTEHTPESFTALVEPLRSGAQQIVRFTTNHKRKDGTRYDVDVSLQTTIYEDRPAFVAVILDVTDRKKAEEELKKHREHLEELVKEKTKEVNEKLSELERYRDATIDRELRMKELRNRIAEFEKGSKG